MGNKFMRRMVTMIVALAMVMTSGAFAFAEDGGLFSSKKGAVTKVSSEGNQAGTKLTITWKVDQAADSYIVKVGSKTYETTDTTLTVKTTAGSRVKITITPVYDGENGTAKTGYSRWMKSTKITKATKTLKKKVKLTWKKAKGATAYKVLMKKNGKWTVVKTVKGTSATVKVGKKGTYKFKVRPMKGSYYGVLSNAKSGKAK